MLTGEMSYRLLFVAAMFVSQEITELKSQSHQKQLSQFIQNLAAKGYDKRIRPYEDKATQVSIQIGLLAVGPVNLQRMTMGSDILLRLWWQDPRLAFDNNTDLTLSENPAALIWIPDVYIFNAIETKNHKALKRNLRVKIGPSGNIYISWRLTIEFSCDMNFQLFPMDTQICTMNLESFAYTSKEVSLEWIQIAEAIEFTRNPKLSGYTIKAIGNVTDQFDYAKFKILQAVFSLKRQFHFYLYHTYIPSCLIVILSFAGFWIPVHAIPARVTLIVTSFLTSMVVFSDAGNTIPHVPYHTAVELFALINMIFIFMTMIEYVTILSQLNNAQKPKTKRRGPQFVSFSLNPFQNHHINHGFEENDNYIRDRSLKPSSENQNKEARSEENRNLLLHETHNLDRISRICFPLSYFIFLIVYFIYYFFIAK
ncbi:glycine receptor subunit alpha-3-like isoform X2 [Rhopilema esculentum]|uniref:glycine receptor subunit alpha-3-like isoform X2 n=1 Tax=Rhopilema esculentum TaxID=499914 RepID=UPI0031E039B5